MFGNADLKYELDHIRDRGRRRDDGLVSEAKKILKRDLFTEKNVLQNLADYKSSFGAADEEDLDESAVFTLSEIKQVAILYRLKFLESEFFKPEIPYEASLKIKSLNERFHKEIKTFKILAPYESFAKSKSNGFAILFVKTNYDNYCLVHGWGKTLKQIRRLVFLPLRRFENLVMTVVAVTLILALSLPTKLITLDPRATYWSGYRAAAFFHLLIFNFGATVYLTFAFSKNFSGTVWNRYKDFG